MMLRRDAAFEPEAVKAMADAYDSVMSKLNGRRTPGMSELVARHIVELAARGERNAMRLRNRVLRDLAA
jgi:hypothetical protein